MEKFDALLEVAERLNGPNGCPWDRKQNFFTLQPYVLEEAHEVIEAVDQKDDKKIVEELGDLLYTIIFYGKLAEKEGRFSIGDVIETVREKLIRRHPHVFGETEVKNAEEVVHHWEKIKKSEKSNEKRESALDGIPPTLPTLIKAQKILKRIDRAKGPVMAEKKCETLTEEEVGSELIDLVICSEKSGVDAESALRRALSSYEERFRKWEKEKA